MKFYEAAKYYYTGGMHEPGGGLAFAFNASFWGKLSSWEKSVLEAAATKWNFLPFRPGLVGGHCIGVDPYYLTYKAKSVGLKPKIILAGRKLNDNMHKHIAVSYTHLRAHET